MMDDGWLRKKVMYSVPLAGVEILFLGLPSLASTAVLVFFLTGDLLGRALSALRLTGAPNKFSHNW